MYLMYALGFIYGDVLVHGPCTVAVCCCVCEHLVGCKESVCGILLSTSRCPIVLFVVFCRRTEKLTASSLSSAQVFVHLRVAIIS